MSAQHPSLIEYRREAERSGRRARQARAARQLRRRYARRQRWGGYVLGALVTLAALGAVVLVAVLAGAQVP